jgi:hypothetical protein
MKHDHLIEIDPVGARGWLGVVLVVCGVSLVPVGYWFRGHGVSVAGGLLILVGCALFASKRNVERVARVEGEANVHARRPGLISGDVHNHSGWLSGGRKAEPAIPLGAEDGRSGDAGSATGD